MLFAADCTPKTGPAVHELSPQASRLIVLAGVLLFWATLGLAILALV